MLNLFTGLLNLWDVFTGVLGSYFLSLFSHDFDTLYTRHRSIKFFRRIFTQLFELLLDFSGVNRVLVGAIILFDQVQDITIVEIFVTCCMGMNISLFLEYFVLDFMRFLLFSLLLNLLGLRDHRLRRRTEKLLSE